VKTNEIEYAAGAFRAVETQKMHFRINARGKRDQTPEMIAGEMAKVDQQVAAYVAALGQADDQPGEQQDEPVPAVKPGIR
jgi:hypothetical protein